MLQHRFEDRRRSLFAFGAEVVQAFHDGPAVVAALLNLVDHLPQVLADFAAPEVAGFAIEAVAPQLAQAIGPDFGAGAFRTHERIVLGHAVVPPGAYAARLA